MLYAGWFGLLFYALASGLPILIQGFLGPVVQRRKPNLLSFTDFVAQVQNCSLSLTTPDAMLRPHQVPQARGPDGALMRQAMPE